MILDFIDAIRSGQPPRTDGAAGLRVQQRGEGGLESAAARQPGAIAL